MKTIFVFLCIFVTVTQVSCYQIGYTPKYPIKAAPKTPSKKLYLSKHVITDTGEIDGGILVNDEGIIDAVLTRDFVNRLVAMEFLNLKIVDGGDLVLMPGVVDTHVHVNEPGRTSWEGYVTATQAAASGGITTIFDMPLNSIPPTTTLQNLKIKASIAKEEVYVDVGFWGGVIPGNELELRNMVDAGVIGFKCFLIDSGVDEFPMVEPSDVKRALDFLNGTGTVLAFHAEMSLCDNCTSACDYTDEDSLDPSCPDPHLYSTYLGSRPPEMEIKAANTIASFISEYDVHIHVVHVSAADVVPILESARELRIEAGHKGWRGGVTAETSNHYLTIAADEIPPGHSEFKCSPPLRNNENKQVLWEYVRDKRLDLIASDHSPTIVDNKTPNFMTAWGGISSVQFDLPIFWTQASARGFDLSDVSNYLSAGPARLAGMQDKKGSLRPGLDADFIYFDPNASFVVTPEIIRFKNKISPYMNKVLRGKVMQTYLRGELIYSNDQLIGGPKGQLLLNIDV